MSADSLIPAGKPRRCRHCRRPIPKGPAYDGLGSRCAEEAGLIPHPVRLARPVRETADDSPNLLDLIPESEARVTPVDPLAEPQRIAFIGDWHMNGRWAVRAIEHAASQHADVIVHLGDYGYMFNARFMREVETALARHGMPLLFVDGNHEAFPTLLRHPVQGNGLRKLTDHVWHLPRGFRWEWAGIRFVALGGAYSVDRPWREPGVSWWKEEMITAEQAAETVAGGTADVLASHDCPAGVVIPGIDDRNEPPPFPPLEIMRSNEHRQVLRQVVDVVRPRWIWHGHYHLRHEMTADLGYGPVRVVGLDCDETRLDRNVRVVPLDDLRPDGDDRA